MKTVLVTGGTGFVGANLVRRLLADGHDVHLVVRRDHAMWRLRGIEPDVTLHEMHLGTDAAQTRALMESVRPDWVFHLAAHGAYSWQTDVAEIFRTNLDATIHLVEAALATGFEAFVHTGSSSEYGVKPNAPAETEYLDPNSCYAIAKAAATHFCRLMARTRDANIITLRLYSVYGLFEDPNRLMPALITSGRRGEWPPLVNPKTARDYVHVDDVCDACIRAAEIPAAERGAIYNVGTGVQTSLDEVVGVAKRVLRIDAEPAWGTMEGRIWDTSTWVADPGKIRRSLEWMPQVPFEEGFRHMAEHYESHA